MAKRILSVCYDAVLLNTRRMLLEHEGYVVTSALGFTEAISRCMEGGIDLFILCHSLPDKNKEQLIKMFRSGCSAPVLSLRKTGERIVTAADYQVFSHKPDELLNAIARIFSRRVSAPG